MTSPKKSPKCHKVKPYCLPTKSGKGKSPCEKTRNGITRKGTNVNSYLRGNCAFRKSMKRSPSKNQAARLITEAVRRMSAKKRAAKASSHKVFSNVNAGMNATKVGGTFHTAAGKYRKDSGKKYTKLP